MHTVTILSIDGGGIRGLIPAMVLAEIEARTQKRAYELFDVVAGTSTGGLLALALTRPEQAGGKTARFSAEQLIGLYVQNGAEIFSSSLGWKLKTLFGVAGPKYDGQAFDRILAQYFGDFRLHDALTNVLVTAYDTEGPAPAFFKSWRALRPVLGGGRNPYDYLMRDIARATASAPTYFPPLRLPDLVEGQRVMSLIDGGVFAVNPGMCALADAYQLHPEAKVYVVSLGTGDTERAIPWKQAHGWGLLGWARPILDIVFDGSSDTVEYELGEILPTVRGGVQRRLQLKLPAANASMDDASPPNIAALQGLARDFIRKSTAILDQVSRELVDAVSSRAPRGAPLDNPA